MKRKENEEESRSMDEGHIRTTGGQQCGHEDSREEKRKSAM
jgi:hypothetical protein